MTRPHDDARAATTLMQTPCGAWTVPATTPPVIAEALHAGTYEADLLDALAAAPLGADDRVVEAGTGIGWATLALARRVAMVWTVEADPLLYRCARANLAHHSHPGTVLQQHAALVPLATPPAAAGAGSGGNATTFTRRAEWWNSGLAAVAPPPFRDVARERTTTVPVTTLLPLIQCVAATAVVLDVEGAEYAVLAAAAPLPPTVRVVVVEWHGYAARRRRQGHRTLTRQGFAPLPHWDACQQRQTEAPGPTYTAVSVLTR